jgi:hypothetical protein
VSARIFSTRPGILQILRANADAAKLKQSHCRSTSRRTASGVGTPLQAKGDLRRRRAYLCPVSSCAAVAPGAGPAAAIPSAITTPPTAAVQANAAMTARKLGGRGHRSGIGSPQLCLPGFLDK